MIPKPIKNPKLNKKESTIERRNPCDSEIPEWLQEFREKLVDDEIPVLGDSNASSSHEASLEPLFKRREDLGKHSVYTHFPKDRNCEICKRTKITRAPCRRRNGGAVPCAENFGDLITADHKVLRDNCESRNNNQYAVVVQDLATQWIQAYPEHMQTQRRGMRCQITSKVIPLRDLQFFTVFKRLMDRPTAVLCPSWSSQKRQAFSAASFGFQRAAVNCNRGLDHLLSLGLGPGRHQLLAKQLTCPFSVSVLGDEDLEFAALAAAVWGPFLPSQLSLECPVAGTRTVW